MKVYLLVEDYGYDGGESPKGVFPSAEAAMEGAKEHTTPQGTDVEWKTEREFKDSAPYIHARTGVSDYKFEIQEFELTRKGNSREFDAAVLRMAAEILRYRFGVIVTENERKALVAAAERIEQRMQSMSSEVLKDERGNGQ